MSTPKRRQGALLQQAGPLSDDALQIWALIDGQRQVHQLAQDLGWVGPQGTRRAFQALDLLADRGLLAARLAPPVAAMPFAGQTGLNRRQVLQKLAAGLVTGVAVAGVARAALAEPAKDSPARAEYQRRAEEAQKQLATEKKKVDEANAKYKEAQACHEQATRVDEASRKKLDCPSLQRVQEQKQKAEVQLTNARHREQQIKRHPLRRVREGEEENAKQQ